MIAKSLHIGLNRIDPAHYGTDAPLSGCINDATEMRKIANSRGFASTLLTNEQATTRAVYDYLIDRSREMNAGDTLLVTFAGHGTNVPDENHDEVEGTVDQTWCLYDREIVDDELAELWALFEPGVRIVLVSDSCHSEGIARALALVAAARSRNVDRELVRGSNELGLLIGDHTREVGRITGHRTLPDNFRNSVLQQHRELYSNIQQTTRGSEKVRIRATVITLAACQNDQVAADGERNGYYTSYLLSIWNTGAFRGSYRAFQDQIRAAIGSVQTPTYKLEGAANPAFEAETPFTTGVPAVPPGTVTHKNGQIEWPMPVNVVDALKNGGTISVSIYGAN